MKERVKFRNIENAFYDFFTNSILRVSLLKFYIGIKDKDIKIPADFLNKKYSPEELSEHKPQAFRQ